MAIADLFSAPAAKPKNDAQQAHVQLYEHLREDDDCAEDRAFLNERWGIFNALGLADPDFVRRFSVECGSRIWEIYLATALASWGWDLLPAKKPGHGPDFAVVIDGRMVWFEATVPTAGSERVKGAANRDRVQAPRDRIIRGRELDRTIALRYLSGMAEKRVKHAGWLASGMVALDDIFVIALSGAMIPEAMIEHRAKPPRIVAALFASASTLPSFPPTAGT